MDNKTEKELTQDDEKLLVQLADVYNFIKASETTQTIANYTLGDYIDKAIKEIEGPTENDRPDKLKRLDMIESSLNFIVQKLE